MLHCLFAELFWSMHRWLAPPPGGQQAQAKVAQEFVAAVCGSSLWQQSRGKVKEVWYIYVV